ncbi:MAG: MFS transporter [Pseudomonadales bacterium]
MKPRDLERPAILAAGISVGAAGMLIFNLLPIILGSAAESLALDTREIGLLGAIYLTGFALVNLSQIVWIRRVNWRLGAVGGALVAIAASIAAANAENFTALASGLLLAGCGAGAVFGITVTLFGDTSDPPRYYGFKLGSELLINVIIMLGVSMIVLEQFGFRGVMYTVAAAFALLCLPGFRLPRQGVKGVDRDTGVSLRTGFGSLELWIAAVALLCFFGACSGIWVYVERLGAFKDFGAVQVGIGVTGAVFATGLGGIAAGLLGDRFGCVVPLLAGGVIYVAALPVILQANTLYIYVAGMCIYGFTWQFIVAYLMGLVAFADQSGRFTVLNSATLGIGGALGPLLAAAVFQNNAFGAIFLLAGTIASLAIGLGIFVDRSLGTNHLTSLEDAA